MALERPSEYSLATRLSDAPLTVKLGGGKSWQPKNFDLQPHGDVLLYQALAKSYNLASARLGMELGLDAVIDMLARLGVEQGVPRGTGAVIGCGRIFAYGHGGDVPIDSGWRVSHATAQHPGYR